MIDYGPPPAADEIEVTVFGPGLGEAVVVHLGEDNWILVDSCVSENGSAPASAEYLTALGVETDRVRAIVATHWHDDHVRAISQLARTYIEADFFISGVLREQEALAFLATYSGRIAPGQTGGTKELVSVLHELNGKRLVKPTQSRTYLVDEKINGRNVKVSALSPLPAANQKAAAHLAQYLVKKDQAINKAPPEPSPNAAAIVLHLDFGGGDAVLLGADLEDNKVWGWSAMVADDWALKKENSGAYKVSHHGSKSGDSDHIWTTLLTKNPVACITPFIFGRHNLPTDDDKARIRARTNQAYICSGASRKPAIDSEQLKRLNDICTKVRRVDTGLGAVQLRKKIDADSWSIALFGSAQKL